MLRQVPGRSSPQSRGRLYTRYTRTQPRRACSCLQPDCSATRRSVATLALVASGAAPRRADEGLLRGSRRSRWCSRPMSCGANCRLVRWIDGVARRCRPALRWPRDGEAAGGCGAGGAGAGREPGEGAGTDHGGRGLCRRAAGRQAGAARRGACGAAGDGGAAICWARW